MPLATILSLSVVFVSRIQIVLPIHFDALRSKATRGLHNHYGKLSQRDVGSIFKNWPPVIRGFHSKEVFCK